MIRGPELILTERTTSLKHSGVIGGQGDNTKKLQNIKPPDVPLEAATVTNSAGKFVASDVLFLANKYKTPLKV